MLDLLEVRRATRLGDREGLRNSVGVWRLLKHRPFHSRAEPIGAIAQRWIRSIPGTTVLSVERNRLWYRLAIDFWSGAMRATASENSQTTELETRPAWRIRSH
jgi:hypothetical protein